LDTDYRFKISAKEAIHSKECSITPEAIRQGRMSSRSVSVDIWGPEIPTALLAAGEAAVDTPFASLAHARAFRPEIVPGLRHAVLRNGQQLVAVLSFYIHRRSLVVVNRLIRLPDAILAACTAQLLERHPSMQSVEFSDLYPDEPARFNQEAVRQLSWPTIDCAVAELPGSYDAYLQNFSSSTRKNFRYCARRLERESPNVSFRILGAQEINAATVAAVVRLNHLRMASKGKTSGMDESYVSRLTTLSRSHGVACIAADGSEVVAGTLCTRVGHGWTLHVIAHDPRFNHLRLGLLCLLKTMEQAIGAGGTRFNFLWGSSDYKLLFGGKVSALQARRYYRTVGNQLLAFGDIRDCAIQTVRRRLSKWRHRDDKRSAGQG
jgi:hypothetical protein